MIDKIGINIPAENGNDKINENKSHESTKSK